MIEFVSEPIRPLNAGRDTAAMGQGEPGLPGGFTWRDERLAIVRRRGQWKESGTCCGDRYLRRHCYELVMGDGSTWVVYFTRNAGRGGSGRQRWYLYTRTPAIPATA